VLENTADFRSKSNFEGKNVTNFDPFVAQSNFSLNRRSLKFWLK
jgi:hypothetical protein